MLKSTLVFYLKMVGALTRAGFKLNPYDPCLMKQITGGEHITVEFHVDDFKVSQKSDNNIKK